MELKLHVVVPTAEYYFEKIKVNKVYLHYGKSNVEMSFDKNNSVEQFRLYHLRVPNYTPGEEFSFTYTLQENVIKKYIIGESLIHEVKAEQKFKSAPISWYKHHRVNNPKVIRLFPNSGGKHLFCYPLIDNIAVYTKDDFITPYLSYILNIKNKKDQYIALEALYLQLLHHPAIEYKLSSPTLKDAKIRNFLHQQPLFSLHLLAKVTSVSTLRELFLSVDWNDIDRNQRYLNVLRSFYDPNVTNPDFLKGFAPYFEFFVRYFFSYTPNAIIANLESFFECVHQLTSSENTYLNNSNNNSNNNNNNSNYNNNNYNQNNYNNNYNNNYPNNNNNSNYNNKNNYNNNYDNNNYNNDNYNNNNYNQNNYNNNYNNNYHNNNKNNYNNNNYKNGSLGLFEFFAQKLRCNNGVHKIEECNFCKNISKTILQYIEIYNKDEKFIYFSLALANNVECFFHLFSTIFGTLFLQERLNFIEHYKGFIAERFELYVTSKNSFNLSILYSYFETLFSTAKNKENEEANRIRKIELEGELKEINEEISKLVLDVETLFNTLNDSSPSKERRKVNSKIDSLQHQLDRNNNRKEDISKSLNGVDLLNAVIEKLSMKMQQLLLPILYRYSNNKSASNDNLNTLLEIMVNYIPFSDDQMKRILDKMFEDKKNSTLIAFGEQWLQKWGHCFDTPYTGNKIIDLISSKIASSIYHIKTEDISKLLVQLSNDYITYTQKYSLLLQNNSFRENFLKIIFNNYLGKIQDQKVILHLVPFICNDSSQYYSFSKELEEYIRNRTESLLKANFNIPTLSAIFEAIYGKDPKFLVNANFFGSLVRDTLIRLCMIRYDQYGPNNLDKNSIGYKIHKLLYYGEFWYRVLQLEQKLKAKCNLGDGENGVYFQQMQEIWDEVRQYSSSNRWRVKDIDVITRASINPNLLKLYLKDDLKHQVMKIDSVRAQLKQIEKFLQVLCNGTVEQNDLLQYIQNLNFENMKVNELDQCILPLQNVIELSTRYEKYWNSHSFRNILSATTHNNEEEEEEEEENEEEEDEEEDEEVGIPENILAKQPLMTFSANMDKYDKARIQFEETWDKLSHSINDVSYAFAIELLKGYPSESIVNLNNEIQIVRKLIPNLRKFESSDLHYMCNFTALFNFLLVYLKFIDLFDIPKDYYEDLRGELDDIQKNPNNTSLAILNQTLRKVQLIRDKLIAKHWSEDMQSSTFECFKTLSNSKSLIQFLVQTGDADLRDLMDAVEEHSDNFVREETVRDIVQVKHFLKDFIEWNSQQKLDDKEAKDFFQKFHEEAKKLFASLQNQENKNMVIKIDSVNENSFALKRLFTKVGNRGELTKEIVKSILKSGVHVLEPFHYSVELSDSNNVYSQQELMDMRSRALLICNSISSNRIIQQQIENVNIVPLKDENNEEKLLEDFKFFAEQIDLAKEISLIAFDLKSLGHFEFITWRENRKVREGNLQELRDILSFNLHSWRIRLNSIRQHCYLLNFYHGSQIVNLLNLFKSNHITEDDIGFRLLLRTLPNVKVDSILPSITENVYPNWEDLIQSAIEYIEVDIDVRASLQHLTQTEKELYNLGKYLTIISDNNHFISTVKLSRNIENFYTTVKFPVSEAKQSQEGIEFYTVASDLFTQLLSVYIKYQTIPYSHNLLFCEPSTSREEVDIFLQRCYFGSCEPFRTSNQVFSIVNIERLSSEQQNRVVEMIDYLKFLTKEQESRGRHLAIFMQSTDRYLPSIERFITYSHSTMNLPLSVIKEYCSLLCNNQLHILASNISGLGKSKRAQEISSSKKLVTYNLPIHDQVIRTDIIASIRKYFCENSGSKALHIHIGKVSDVLLVNTIIFEMLMVGSLSTQEYNLPCRIIPLIIIEIASTPFNSLFSSLFLSQLFNVEYLEWNLSRFDPAQEIDSPIQIVCNYLQAIESNTIQSLDFTFDFLEGNVRLFNSAEAIVLLQKHFFEKLKPSQKDCMNFALLQVYLKVFSYNCLRMSKSPFFTTENMSFSFRNAPCNIRKVLVEGFSRMAIEFSTRSIDQARNEQLVAERMDEDELEHLAKSVEAMVKWNDSDHLMIFFNHHEATTISAVYKNVQIIPRELSEFFRIQNREQPLPQLSNDNVEGLWKILIMCCSPNGEYGLDKEICNGYALTLDNLLKMFAIVLRINSDLPVVIMGESGCGKTSLIQILSKIYQSPLISYTCHAGTNLSDIENVLLKANEYGKFGVAVWIFFDEINTCDHLGVIAELLCNRSFLGAKVEENFKFLVACNPYRLRPISAFDHIHGLRSKLVHDSMSRLVYRVHPLPLPLFDYIWDFGSLSRQEQEKYIFRMVEDSLMAKEENHSSIGDARIFCELLMYSQLFISERVSVVSVSLRDIRRCILLYQWFYEVLKNRADMKYVNFDISRYATALALCHCYYVRIDNRKDRKTYSGHLSQKLQWYSTPNRRSLNRVEVLLMEEQRFYVDMMTIPSGIAKNEALLENVFVLLICILNRLPVFIVGKPGCSKSLAMQLIKSNLRGPDSPHPYFRELPQIFPVTYQGSEQSTSEGISKIFEKAINAKSKDVLPCVVLDEIGLAEISPHNPLKILHPLLEPSDTFDEENTNNYPRPQVAVVGISNWALDPAKMNRAVHISRPEPDMQDLIGTGTEIVRGELLNQYSKDEANQKVEERTINRIITSIAQGYFKYVALFSEVPPKNFHGLRDYYSTIKSIATLIVNKFKEAQVIFIDEDLIIKMKILLERNFGGLPSRLPKIQELFLSSLGTVSAGYPRFDVVDLVKSNVVDHYARHLLLITDEDTGISALRNCLNLVEKKCIVLIGSKFRDDLCEEHNYRLLSKIILTMEEDNILVLSDLDPIYGALYDLLNQNYSHVGKVQNCRIALGAYSSPMCAVHPNFRCIVLQRESDIEYSDPPFLNRFEKQRLSFSDLLCNQRTKKIHQELHRWVKDISKVPKITIASNNMETEELGSRFSVNDFFLGYSKDTIPSLVLHRVSSKFEENQLGDTEEELLDLCKQDLLWLARVEGIVRIPRSKFAE